METIDKIQYVLNNICLPISLILFVLALMFKFMHLTNDEEEEEKKDEQTTGESDTTPIR